MFIKFADISNSARSWPIAKSWAERVMEVMVRILCRLTRLGVFQARGARTQNGVANLPFYGQIVSGKFYCRCFFTLQKVPKCQATFIEFVIQPFVDVVVQVIPKMHAVLNANVTFNLTQWRQLSSQDTTPNFV